MQEAVLVIIAAICNFILVTLWFSSVGRSIFKKDKEISNERLKDARTYLVSFIGSLWASYGMFVLLKHVRPNGIFELFSVAVGTWLFVIVALGVKSYAFRGKTIKDFIIDYGIDFIGLVLMCFIIWPNY